MIMLINRLQDALVKQGESYEETIQILKELKTERANLIKELEKNEKTYNRA